jgi:hypothetical protein
LGNRKIKVLATHFRKMLIGDGKDEKMLNNIMGEWYEFKVIGQKLTLLDLLHKVVSMSDTFPLLSKLLSIVEVLPMSTASCEQGFSVMNMVKNKLGQHCRQAA